MHDLAIQAWDPFVAWLVLGVGVVVLLATLLSPLRALPRAISALTGGSVSESGRGPVWLALASSVGMGSVTGGVLAVTTAGPGALVWMWITTILGMGLAFAEASVAARHPDDSEAADVHLLGAGQAGRLLAPMYALAVLVFALVVGAAFQSNQAAAFVATATHIPAGSVAIGLAVTAAPFVLLPRLARPLLMVVPFALLVYAALLLGHTLSGDAMLTLLLGDAVNQAFGLAPAAGGAAGGGVGLLVAYGVLRGTLAGSGGTGSAALLDLRTSSRSAAGAVAMLGPLLAGGVLGSIGGLLVLDGSSDSMEVAEAELVPLERSQARGLRPNPRVGQTIVLPEDTTMESGGHYAMKVRSNPRGHAQAKLVVPEQNPNLSEEDRKRKPHVALPHYGIARESATVVFRPRDSERAKVSSWDVRIPCEREVKPLPGGDGKEYLLLRPKDPEIDMRRLAVQLDLLTQPFVVFDDFSFVGEVGRATSPDVTLGEHLAMFEAPSADRSFNPKLHEFFRMGYRGPYADSDEPRPPWAFVGHEGFAPEIGSVVELTIKGDPRGDDVLALTRSGSVEAPPWDLLLDARTIVLRHETDATQDIRIPVTPRFELYRVRFDIADERYQDMRVVKDMEGYSAPRLVVPDYEFRVEVRGDARLPQKYEGRRTLVPIHPLGEPQGPHGEGDTYTPHPGELIAMGMAAPVVTYEGAEVIAATVGRDSGTAGRFTTLVAIVLFALGAIVAWAELGSRAATAVFGSIGGPALRLTMLAGTALGATWSLTTLLPLVDLSIAAVVVPNVVGLLLMLGKIRAASSATDDIDAPQ